MVNDDQLRFQAIEENSVLTSPLTAGGYDDPYSTACCNNSPYKGNGNEKVPNQSNLRSNPHTNSVVSEVSKKKKETPAIGSIGKEGRIMCRTSTLTLIFKRWKDSYWLHIHPTTIHVFEKKESMDEWKMLNMTGDDCSSNDKHMKKLIKWSINFDTAGLVYKRMQKAEKKKCKRMNMPSPKFKIKSHNNYVSPIVYAMEEVRSKYYNGPSSALLHTCKISYLSSSGRTIAAAFGSTKSTDLKQFRATVRSCIKLVIKYTTKKCKDKNVANQGTVNSGSTMGGTDVSGAGYSAVASEFSNTVYGRNTMTPETLKWIDSNNSSSTTDSTIVSTDMRGVGYQL